MPREARRPCPEIIASAEQASNRHRGESLVQASAPYALFSTYSLARLMHGKAVASLAVCLDASSTVAPRCQVMRGLRSGCDAKNARALRTHSAVRNGAWSGAMLLEVSSRCVFKSRTRSLSAQQVPY
jgi:hypothetical protein